MIDEWFLRSAEDERQRLVLLNAVTDWGIRSAAAFSPGVSVVVFGSVVRGDYWVGSDLDIIPVGGEVQDRQAIIRQLSELGRIHGAKSTEAWTAVSTEYLQHLRATRPGDRVAPYPIQFGLHGFDTVGHHVTVLGDDPLVGLSVPLADDLVALATQRLLAFKDPGHDWFDREGKSAPEAIKVAVLLESLRRSLAPSRHKHVIVSLFDQIVPPFQGKERWREIWLRYKAGAGPLGFEVDFRDALVSALCSR